MLTFKQYLSCLFFMFALPGFLLGETPWEDRFGNVKIYISDDAQVVDVVRAYNQALEIQSQQKKPSGLAIYANSLDSLKDVEDFQNIIHLGTLKEELNENSYVIPAGTQVFLNRLTSTAPETLNPNNPQIKSSSVLYRFNRNEKPYVLLVKDKTKPIITLPGGTMTRAQEGDYESCACREFAEETADANNPGITLERNSLSPIATMHSLFGNLFGITNIDDEARFFSYEENNCEAIAQLFQKGIEDENGVIYQEINNDEIDFIAAIPVPDINTECNEYNIEALNNLVSNIPSTINGTRISSIHRLVIAHHFYGKCMITINRDDAGAEGIKGPNWQKIEFHHISHL